MNVKNNKRRKTSVEKIEKAFMELLIEKSPSEITVSEISQKAEINRSTFYANFLDIDDLSQNIKEHLLKEFQKIYETEIKSRKNSNDFLKLFYHIKENQTIYNAYFKLGASFTEKEVHYDYTLAEKYFDNKYIDYHIEFFYKGLNAILIKWLNGGCKESPEEIESIIKTEYQGRKL